MATLAGASSSAAAHGRSHSSAEEVINFSTGDPAADPGTEGIAVDRAGNIYVSTSGGGQVWKVAPGSDEPEVLATLIPPTGGAGFGVLGLELVGDSLYAAVHTLESPDLNGVWVINIKTGETEHLDGTEAIVLPNDLTHWRGALYVTDSFSGAVWRVDDSGVEPWLQDELLEGTGELVEGLPLGANGIDVHRGRLYIANLEKGMVVKVRISRHGDPSKAKVYNSVDGRPDGLEVDRWGRPHVVLLDKNALVRVGRRSNKTLIDDPEVLDAPASLVFGRGRHRSTIYVVNFSIGEGFPGIIEPSTVGPSVVAYR